VGFVENWKSERLQRTGVDLVKKWRNNGEKRWRQWGREGCLWCATVERENVVFIVEDEL